LRVLSRKTLRQFWDLREDARDALTTWFTVAEKADWHSLINVQETFRTAEFANGYTVFNIKGNKYRLIVKMEYTKKLVFIKCVLTHAEYDKGNWK